MKRAIEESFPIVEINRLAVRERNAFKPIYRMHKWFARRASSVFRAILLSSMKPAGTDIMKEFYKDHTGDPDTNGVRVLDPFMGGGTTVIEALRLGCDVTGIDLNPVAWFIVKTEAEQVDIAKLKDAFKRLEERITISGKPLKEEIHSYYKTECPCCGDGIEDADIIHTFWIKSAICTNPECKKEVPLFNNYIISSKSPSVKYIDDYECSNCKKVFDLDIDRISLVAENSLTVDSSKNPAGDLRGNKKWAVLDDITHSAICPHCSIENDVKSTTTFKKATRKKVPLSVLSCPHCYAVWQYRGTLDDNVTCPSCSTKYNCKQGNIPSRGAFLCPSCGTKDKIIKSIDMLPKETLLPYYPYAIEGFCGNCYGKGDNETMDFMTQNVEAQKHTCNIKKNNGKFFKKVMPIDIKRFQDAELNWDKHNDKLLFPKQQVPYGEKTKSGLIKHHFDYWYKLFNKRQLFCLSTLLTAISEENNSKLRDVLLCSFSNSLNDNNMFCSYAQPRNHLVGVFARHDFHPKNDPLEGNVWGAKYGHGGFSGYWKSIIDGIKYAQNPYDLSDNAVQQNEYRDLVANGSFNLLCGNSETVKVYDSLYDIVITDPPYADNVNYSELADFFYVWQKALLSKVYTHYSPEMAPKSEEIIENPTRGKSLEDYEQSLSGVWAKCYTILKDDGILAFTFHHAEGSAWEALLESICNAGFLIEAIYPIHGEAENSLHLMDKESISYDLIHICKKRVGESSKRSWASVRHEIRKRARKEIKLIEYGRYGGEKLAPADINIVLIGKCLELYSKHYGTIVDYKDEVVPLKDALASIRMMVEQLITTQQPLPSELEHIDTISYVYLTCLCDRKEIKSDEVHKATRGILEISELSKAGVMRKGRAERGRTYEVKTPDERYKDLEGLFKRKSAVIQQGTLFPEMEEGKFDNVTLVDVIHFLMGLAHESEDIVPWIREFEPVIPQVRIAMEYLREKNPTFQEPISKVLSLIEV